MTPGARENSTSIHFCPSVCVSNFKLGKCCGCGNLICRGDEITNVCESEGMTLRYRSHVNGDWYRPNTGNRWVHRDCSVEEDGIILWTVYSGEIQSKLDQIHSPLILEYDFCEKYTNNSDDEWVIDCKPTD